MATRWKFEGFVVMSNDSAAANPAPMFVPPAHGHVALPYAPIAASTVDESVVSGWMVLALLLNVTTAT